MSAESGPSAQRVCVRCGRVGVQQYISARQDGTHAVTGEAWVCANERACRRRSVSSPRPARKAATPAIVRAERALVEKWHGTLGRAFHPSRIEEATATLAAALDVEEMAQAIYESAVHNSAPGFPMWDVQTERIREYWRVYARAARTALLGADS